MDTQLRNELYIKLMRDFDVYGMALYIGQGIAPEDLSESFCQLPWGCVITSHRDLSFDQIFQEAGKRNVTTCVEREDITGRFFSPNQFYITHLYGDEGSSSSIHEEIDSEDPETINDLKKRNAIKIFEYLLDRIRAENGKMLVIGYDGDDDQEFPAAEFYLRFFDKHDAVFFFQAVAHDDRLRNIAKKRNAWFDESLLEIVDAYEEEDQSEENEQRIWGAKHVFFKEKQHVFIEADFLEKTSYFLQLLTEQTVRQFIPYGKKLQELWFFNFLHRSSIEPQWYGYLPQTEFYLKRNFEDTLVALVRRLLFFHRVPEKKGKDLSVILQGAPGSSKSIELCALAYRIYNEERNPVIYIKNDSLTFSSGSDEFELLDELMTKIEQKGDNDMRILILWDSASYRNVTREADNLALELSNRGRRFVLVCTAYEKSGDKYTASHSEAGWYRYTKDRGIHPIPSDDVEAGHGHNVYFDGKHYFVSATRMIEPGEKAKLKEKVRRFILQDKDVFESKWASMEYDVRNSGGGDSVNDIFYCFYSLIRTLQPQLDRGLTREQDYIARYVKTQLDIIAGKQTSVEPAMSDMMIALKKAGIELTNEEYQLMNQAEEDLNQRYDLDKFNICIALFSRFKLRTPYGLAYFMFRKDKTIAETSYDVSHRDLMNVLMNDFSYIIYSKEDHSYLFRNSLEAVLFLRNKNISEEAQINIICEMLDYYASTWSSDGFVDPVLAHELPKLLRMIGPNTEYGPFWSDGAQCDVHQRLLKHLEKIIQKLGYMRTEQMVPDPEGTFAHIEITFIREFYGKNRNRIFRDFDDSELHQGKEQESVLQESYCTRLFKLRDAVSLAKETAKKIETLLQMESISSRANKSRRFFLQGQMNSMRVERALCDTNFNVVKKEYLAFCHQYAVHPNREIERLTGDAYLGLYQTLYEAICSDPMNGYAYNALFQVFEEEYQKCRAENKQEEMLRRLSEVRLIADEAASLEIQNRGGNRDELGNHLARIASYSREQRICIADVMEGDSTHPFVNLFQNMLAKNNASAICFVCQQELDDAGLGVKELLERPFSISEKQRNICRRIMKFMKREEYQACVEHDPYALYFLLRVSWMYYNRSLLEDGSEAKKTYLNKAAWQDIACICDNYHHRVRDKERWGLRPIVELLRALAQIHLFDKYADAADIMRDLEEFSIFSYRRMRVPYLVCDEYGTPRRYTGKVISLDSDNQFKGYIRFESLPIRRGVRFTNKNLGLRMRPAENAVLSDLELGLGYAGFSAYRQEGREGESER